MSLRKLARNVIDLDEKEIFVEVFQDPLNRDFVIALNTEPGEFDRLGIQSQLFTLGVDSNGLPLPEYTQTTKFIKQTLKSPPQPIDRTTLKDTGEFYRSFRVRLGDGEFTIVADPVKEDGNLFDKYGEEIVGLTEQSKDELVKFIAPEVARIVRERICR